MSDDEFADDVYLMTLYGTLRKKTRDAFGDAVQVAVDRPDPDLTDEYEPDFRLQLNNLRQGTPLILFRGTWRECVHFISHGGAGDNVLRCTGTPAPKPGLRSTYTAVVVNDRIEIIDHDVGRSVTNDAEHVIDDLVARGIDVDAYTIYYVDTMGRRDILRTSEGRFEAFAPGTPKR